MTAQLIYSPIKPTVLMVKRHNKTGILYLCKTQKLKEAHSYLGSGIDWTKHLEENGRDVSTLWVSEVFMTDFIKEVALKLSNDLNVKKSDLWANRVEEDGLMGGDRSEFIDYEKTISKMKKTKNDPKWYEEVGKEARRKGAENTDYSAAMKTRKRNLIKNKGVKNVFQDAEVKAKCKQTCLDKYGYENYSTYLAQRCLVKEIKSLVEKPAKLFGRAWWRKTDSELEQILRKLMKWG